MVLHAIPPLKHSVLQPLAAAESCSRTRESITTAVTHKQLFKHFKLNGLFAMPFLSPFSHLGIELTEYKCQSVFRSAVPLGC